MEPAPCGRLLDHIVAHTYLCEGDARKLFAQLISGVWYCHKKMIVHRGLSVECLLLDKNHNAILTNFGFANHLEKEKDDLMETRCGRPCYAAPELVFSEGSYVGSAVDVWSCGVILYAMLAGYLPFQDDNIGLLNLCVTGASLTFPDYISVEVRDLLGIMLVPNPKHRATLEQVMAHSWLISFQPLFRQSVHDLERAVQAQQQENKQRYQEGIRERAEQHRTANKQGANGPSTLPSRSQSTPDYVTAALVAHRFFEHCDTARAQQQQPLSTSAASARVRPGTTSGARAPLVEDTTPPQGTNVPARSNSTVITSAPNIPKLRRPVTAPPKLNVKTSASDIPTRPKPFTIPLEPTATTSASDILKHPKPGTLSLQSASTTSVSDIPHDLKPELPVILSAPDIPRNSTAEVSPSGTSISNVPMHPGAGSLGPEVTLSYMAPDETTNLKEYAIPARLSEVCGLEGRSIHSLRGNEAAEIGSKLHTVRSYLCRSKYERQSEFICSI